MDFEFMRDWANALRSEKYASCQIKGRLHDGNKGFCALGVALDFRGNTWKVIDDPAFSGSLRYYPTIDYLRDRSSFFSWSIFAGMNDSGTSFNDIARQIDSWVDDMEIGKPDEKIPHIEIIPDEEPIPVRKTDPIPEPTEIPEPVEEPALD